MTERIPGFHAIVPAGGAGTRLWPLSRQGRPKFLLDLTGSGRSLLQGTVDRLLPLTGAEGTLVVTGTAHAPAVAQQLPALPAANLLAEPAPRDSTAAICLAAAVVAARDPEAVVGSFAADQVIAEVDAFADAVAQAVAVARAGYVVTIGIEPTFASTAFGYIACGEDVGVEGAPDGRRVVEFVEKPDADTATAYLASGTYRWNAGMFIARADVLLEQLAASRPALHAGLLEIAAAWDTPDREEVLHRVWPGLEKVAIDYAIAEPAAAAGKVAVVPADLGWDDIGDVDSLAGLLPVADDAGVRVLGDAAHVLAAESEATVLVAPGSGRLVAVLGLSDVVVVDTPDALLVTTRAKAQQVKGLVDRLKAQGRADLT
ncbi:MAG: mannose-1-phosphate guanylyltransferase [Kineosporiaceae bacterium]